MFHSQIIAAPDPAPFKKPRFISWPSVCDTTRVNWLGPEAPNRAPPSPAIENHVQYSRLFDPRSDQPTDARVLAACSSIDCVAPPVDPSLTFTAVADPPAVSGKLYNSIICSPDVPLSAVPQSRSNRADAQSAEKPKKNKKRGRRAVFDEVRRGELLGMIKSGCTMRYAARRVGVNHATVVKASNRDPMFADRLARAQQERDTLSVHRIQNAGEKSWRAAAWLLERNEPQDFSLHHKNCDPWTVRGQRRLKKLITETVDRALAKQAENRRDPAIDRAMQLIEDRLGEIETPDDACDESDDEQPQFVDTDNDQPEVDLDEDLPDEDFQENDGYESEAAAVESYRQLLRKLNRPFRRRR